MQSCIPNKQWPDYVNRFSNDHQGWCATVELLDHINGPQKLAEDLPLVGLSFDSKGSRACSVEITVGDRPEASIHHVIDSPRSIYEFDRDTGDVDLQIEPSDGPKVLVHLHDAAPSRSMREIRGGGPCPPFTH